MRVFLIVLLNSLIANLSFATVIDYEVKNFHAVSQLYKQHYKPQSTLVVFDIDDTLLTTTQALGGVGWWDWQSKLLSQHPKSNQLVASNFQGLLEAQHFLFSIIKMQLTDAFILPFMKDLALHHTNWMVLTARGPDLVAITKKQLRDNGFVDANKQVLFATNNLSLPSKRIKNNRLRCPGLKSAIYTSQGMMFLSGADKGKALHCLVSKAKQRYTGIVFVDDSPSNIAAVDKAFAKDKRYKVMAILYTHEHLKEQKFLRSKALQDAVNSQWIKLSRS